MMLNNVTKLAEANKYKAEAKKADAERAKLEFELEELKKESKRFWLLKEKFLKAIAYAILTVPILSFYIVYVIVPSLQTDNIELKLANSRATELNTKVHKRLRQGRK